MQKVLWIKVPVFKANLELRTNPNGSGQVYNANAGRYGVKIKLRWFGVKVQIGYLPTVDEKESVAGVLPYCTSPGGFDGVKPTHVGPVTGSSGFNLSNNYWLLNLFHYKFTRDGAGCSLFDSHVGLNGFLSANLDYHYCSDGTQFCFIPVQSALDYGNVNSASELGHSIEGDNVNTKMGLLNPAISVMMGWPRSSGGFLQSSNHNYEHLTWRNPLNGGDVNIPNITGQPNTFTNPNTYFSCINTSDVTERYIYNLEIGDEEMYLENRNLPWRGDFQAEYDIHVNERNPHYVYTSQPFNLGSPTLDGIYSRENSFTTITAAGNGAANFFYDRVQVPGLNNIGISITNPSTLASPPGLIEGPLYICCQNYVVTQRKALVQPGKDTMQPMERTYLQLYPNPATGKQLMLRYVLNNKSKVQVSIYNATGQPVLQRQLPAAFAKLTVQQQALSLPHLPPGMYLLRLSSGTETKTARFIVTR